MTDTSSILKYLKVKALAEQGEQGERANARRILTKMEQDHPGIKQAAEQHQKSQERQQESYPAGVWPGEGQRSRAPFVGNWEEIFNFAQEAVRNAYNFANDVAASYMGRLLAEEEVEAYTRATRAGNILVSFRLTLSTYTRARQLNEAQKLAFRQALHEMLDEELDALLD